MGKNKEWEPFSLRCKFTSFSHKLQLHLPHSKDTLGVMSLQHVLVTYHYNYMYRSGDELLKQVTGQSQQQIALCELENFCENLCLGNRILLQQIAQIQSDLIL